MTRESWAKVAHSHYGDDECVAPTECTTCGKPWFDHRVTWCDGDDDKWENAYLKLWGEYADMASALDALLRGTDHRRRAESSPDCPCERCGAGRLALYRFLRLERPPTAEHMEQAERAIDEYKEAE